MDLPLSSGLAVLLAAAAMQADAAGGPGPVEVIPMRMVLYGGDETVEMQWPVVAGGAADAALIAMNQVMSWRNVTGEPFEQTMATWAETRRGFCGADFVVNYNRDGILDITITVDFVGAYPSTFEHWFNFDVRTGDGLLPAEIFLPESSAVLVGVLDSLLHDRVLTAVEENCTGPEGLSPGVYDDPHFTEADLADFSVMEGGMEFHYDFGFPHALLAAEPDGDVFLDWDSLRPFMNPEGPLGAVGH